jgi:acetylornithine/N-succinyldiaminopimelate aminotransferase
MANKPHVTRDDFDHLMVPTYAPSSVIPVRGEGSRLWDQNGREFIDFAGGIAVTCLGHAHPALVAALNEQAGRLWHLSNVMTNEPALRLAEKLCQATFAERVMFCNSGAEANEAALKLARRYAWDHFGEDKREIISFYNSFHGRTLFTVTVGGQPKYTEGFEPLPGGITHLPYDHLNALEAQISDHTCAVIMEPIQGEGGINSPSPEFVRGVRALCDQHQALLIYDEVQTGVGRTGSLYAYMQQDVEPDILSTAKGLGGGFPIGAMLTTEKISASFGVGTHGSTYGGNPLACAVAEAVLDIVNQPALLDGVKTRHQHFKRRLEQMSERYGMFQEIRGQGLLIGCAMSPDRPGQARDLMNAARELGVMVLVAGPDVIRLAPSLIIDEGLIDEGLDRFEKAVAAMAEAPAEA